MNKALILFSLFCLSCWDGERNGRRYDLEETCLKSHKRLKTGFTYVSGHCRAYTYSVTVCDSMRIDTIWEK
jgi:hypothetical protein